MNVSGKVTIKVTSTTTATTQPTSTMTDSTTANSLFYSASTEPVSSSTVIVDNDETSTEFTTYPTSSWSSDYSEETTTMVQYFKISSVLDCSYCNTVHSL